MTTLTVFNARNPDGKRLLVTSDAKDIITRLREFDVVFERWNASKPLSAGADQAAISR
jgi:cupin superfamily acireductone dioxygenase involved in methionine salvage